MVSVKVCDPRTGVFLFVPDDQLDRYRCSGYVIDDAFAPSTKSDPEERALEDYTKAELVTYGEELGLSLREQVKKDTLVKAIEAKLSEGEGKEKEDTLLDTVDIPEGTSRSW